MLPMTTRSHWNDALAGLLEKYGVQPCSPWRIAEGGEPPDDAGDVLTLASGSSMTEPDPREMTVPLLPWRHERRFIELRRLVDDETVTPLLMCRFTRLTDGREAPLEAILYREFDLIEWLSGTPIVGLYASMAAIDEGRAANVIARLTGGAIASVEAGTTLPVGATVRDRHELIARRGVASDRVVDTQVVQSSVYAWTDAGHEQHTDVDAELFGLDAAAAALVRAAYDALRRPESNVALRRQHRRLRRLVELAHESARRGERLAAEATERDLKGAVRPGGTGVSPVHGQDAHATLQPPCTGHSIPPEDEEKEGGAP